MTNASTRYVRTRSVVAVAFKRMNPPQIGLSPVRTQSVDAIREPPGASPERDALCVQRPPWAAQHRVGDIDLPKVFDPFRGAFIERGHCPSWLRWAGST